MPTRKLTICMNKYCFVPYSKAKEWYGKVYIEDPCITWIPILERYLQIPILHFWKLKQILQLEKYIFICFIGDVRFGKYRTMYYNTLSRLLFLESEDGEKFNAFMEPLANTLNSLWQQCTFSILLSKCEYVMLFENLCFVVLFHAIKFYNFQILLS